MRSEESPTEDPGGRYPRRLYLIFAVMAVLCCLGQDYLAARRGGPSYLFHPLSKLQAAQPTPVALPALAGRVLTESGITQRDIQTGSGEDGRPAWVVSLAEDAYQHLASHLLSAFRQNGAVARIEKNEGAGKTTYVWSVSRGASDGMTVSFSCAAPPPPKEAATSPSAAPPGTPSPEKMAAIVIDDMGESLAAFQEICDLKATLTISILPDSPHAVETARAAHERNLEVMLHLPGESLNHREGSPPSSPIIRSDMAPDEIREFVLRSLEKVPFATGVNNHMGSRITQEEQIMAPILAVVKEKGLFFLDSRTGDHSIAYDLARSLGLRATYRSVFLDSKVGVDYSKKRLIELFKLAQKKGRAVAIGHPFPETLQALREGLALAAKYGVRLVFVSQVLEN